MQDNFDDYDDIAGTIEEMSMVLEVAHIEGYGQLNQHGVSYGGKDQAWIYREEMRDCWLETPDCLKWLKQSCA